MWRIIYFFISLLIVLIDYLHYTNLALKTLTTFFITALIVILFEYYLIRKKSPKNILAFFSSLLITVIVVLLTILTLNSIGIHLSRNLKLIILFIEGYLIFGIVAALIPNISDMLKLSKQDKTNTAKILDTSVIVDGRIYDIAEKKFFDGILILPEFVIKEVQFLSDSKDPQKRIRGRRALEILNKMKSSKNILLSVTDIDFRI